MHCQAAIHPTLGKEGRFIMKKAIRWLDINFEAFFGMWAFFAMLLIILSQIFSRNLFGSGTAWGEEVCRYCYVWTSYLGLSFATRNSVHIEIDAIRRLLPEKVQKVLMILTQAIMLYLFVRFFFATMQNVVRAYETNAKFTTLNISKNWVYIAAPIGYGLGALRCVQTLIWKFMHFNCSMPVFVNSYSVLNGGLNNYCFNDELREEYRTKVPDEAYAEVAELKARRAKKKEGNT